MLIACKECHRQYDVGDLAPGSRVRCECGTLSVVPSTRPRQVEMLRCSGCGGRLASKNAACEYCGSKVDPKELRMGGACPECFAQLVVDAKFCISCGVEIDPEAVIKAVSDHGCPACQDQLYICRNQDEYFHQCITCGGIWLSNEAFEGFVEKREAEAAAPDKPRPVLPLDARRRRSREPGRRCPVCKRYMLRNDFAWRSNVFVDRCMGHGYWFDSGELEKISAFIEGGGLAQWREQQQRSAKMRRSRARQRRLARKKKEREETNLIPWLFFLLVS